MGYSRWDADAYATASTIRSTTLNLAKSAGLSDSAAREKIFTQKSIHQLFDPKRVNIRESRDSEANPMSNAIILGLDVTGSMGFIAEKLAVEGLGRLVGGILDRKPVPDPHIMVMAIGDAFCDSAPLQVSQFESDIRISEQLTEIWLEGRGGGNSFESYDIPWYFAATKTSIDCFEKRGKKGYIFTIGDEPPPNRPLPASVLNSLFDAGAERDFSSAEMLQMAEEKYNVFHIVAEEGSYASRYSGEVYSKWGTLLGKRVIKMRNCNYLSEIIISVIEIAEGRDVNEVINSWEDEGIKSAVRYAISY